MFSGLSPEQTELLSMTLMLLFAMVGGATVSAYALRRFFNLAVVLGSFAVSVILIFIVFAVESTIGATGAFIISVLFGASVGADIGGLAMAVSEDEESAIRIVYTALGITTAITFVAGIIGLYGGFDLQFLQQPMLVILFGILGILVLGFVIAFNKLFETLISLGIVVFFSIFMTVHFNTIAFAEEATWGKALTTAMQIFLDIANIVIRIIILLGDKS